MWVAIARIFLQIAAGVGIGAALDKIPDADVKIAATRAGISQEKYPLYKKIGIAALGLAAAFFLLKYVIKHK